MPFFSPSSALFLLPFQFLLVVFGAVFVLLSQCCGCSKKEKQKPKKPDKSSSKTQPPSKTQQSMASKSTTAKAEWANALPSEVSSEANMDYGTLQNFDTQFFGGASPLKPQRGTGKKGPAPPVAKKPPPSKTKPPEKGKKVPPPPPSKKMPRQMGNKQSDQLNDYERMARHKLFSFPISEKTNADKFKEFFSQRRPSSSIIGIPQKPSSGLVPSSHPDYGTLHLVDKDLFTKEQQAKDAKRTPPKAGPLFVSTGDKNYATLGQLDHNIFVKNAPEKPQQTAGGAKFVSASDQNYRTLGQLDHNIFVKK
ncbi:hypothetical protein niasHT_021569 [Heterodera trifolii]|uniref:Uncharacterized protein n=1 Tax=Heterodera trifolii TaxID=157864 RepID=A0ABD2KS47_9BILA